MNIGICLRCVLCLKFGSNQEGSSRAVLSVPNAVLLSLTF